MIRALILAMVAAGALLAGCSAPDATAPTGPGTVHVTGPPPAPTRVTIPAIGATSTLIRTGMLDNGTPEVPDVHTPEQASWATWSPEPGEPGPAVLYGHVDGEQNGHRGVPGIFNRIDELTPGAEIDIDREGADPARFTVYRVDAFPKAELNNAGGSAIATVYGDTPGPELRLVTCGGSFDAYARSYRDQVVVFARLAT